MALTFDWLMKADQQFVSSFSRLLSLENDNFPLLHVNEEALLRSGIKFQLTKQRTRWLDGSTHVWIGRKVVTGEGEKSSGLRFDFMESGNGH